MFFFSSFLAKEKKNQKEKTRFLGQRGVSLTAVSDKGYAPLTGAHCRGGLALVCANMVRQTLIYRTKQIEAVSLRVQPL